MKMQSIDEIRKQEEAVIGDRKRRLEARIDELLKKEGNYLNSEAGHITYPYHDLYAPKVPKDFELLKEIFDAKGYILESRENNGRGDYGGTCLIDYKFSLKAK